MPTIKAIDAVTNPQVAMDTKPAPIESAAVESAPAGEPAAPAIEERMSPKLLALAKKEKMQRERERQIAEREAKIKEQEEQYAKQYIPKDRITKDTLTVLEEMGITRDKLAELILNGPAPVDPVINTLQSELNQIKSQLTESEKRQQEQQAKAYENAVATIRNEAKQLIESNVEFETIKETGNVEAVVELIKKTYEEENTLLTVEEAAKQIEEILVEEGLKYAGLNKIKAKLTPQEAIAEAVQAQAKPKEVQVSGKPQQQLKTLTNAVASSGKPLSARERAIMAFQGQYGR
jgi:hypothetical protein